MLKRIGFPLAIFLCIVLQSCTKETDLISGYVVLDVAKKEYRAVQFIDDLKLETSGKITETVNLTFED
ncbi:hypothetical protein LCGC14_0166170 [marine sediment metagenome]|uniref:Uncharacterized protein n=1 Tax=marine sediment metagenome TaxID=412755 RepID=A0A0F9XC05_9ZZZZ|nr:hypothetical protein [Maribacter sp.]HDZ07147.1 hypothetical protein [Maribacter sp.]HEA79020.1 hypothetical protein [Maribacter sp.]